MPGMDKTIGRLAVASPCAQKWEAMRGDDRVRFCGACAKNVYRLDDLTTTEVRDLIVAQEGKLCWRFFVRKDGTVLTRDCPVGLRRARQRVVAALALCMAVVLAGVVELLRVGGVDRPLPAIAVWSALLKQASVVPAPLVAAPEVKPGAIMGKRMVNFDANNPY